MTVAGVDIGATSTRALVVDLSGEPVGRGTSGGANPNSHPPELAANRIAEALSAAFTDPTAVKHCVLGMAGVSKLSDPAVADLVHGALARIGLGCPVTVLSDAEVAFASATAEPDGTVLIGGTGSVAARIRGRRKTGTVGGYGWLLGDEGSAFWIGRAAVRSTLDTMLSGAPLGPLAAAVLVEALGEAAAGASYGQLISAANAEPPIRLARFAELVSAHVGDDQEAEWIVREAAAALAGQALRARVPGEIAPVVLVGSVVRPGSPVGEAVRFHLEGAGLPVLYSDDAAAGAAWLAAIEVLGPNAPRPRV